MKEMEFYDLLMLSVKQFIEKLSNDEFSQSEIALYVKNFQNKQGLLDDIYIEYLSGSLCIPQSMFDQSESAEHIGCPGIAGEENNNLKSAIEFIEEEYNIVPLPPKRNISDKLLTVFKKNKDVANTFYNRISGISGIRKAVPIANELIALSEMGLANLDIISKKDLLNEIESIVPDVGGRSSFNESLNVIKLTEKRRVACDACKLFYRAFL